MIIDFLQILTGILLSLAALGSVLFFVRLSWPAPVLWFVKLYASALSPLLFFIGLLGIVGGFTTGSLFLVLAGAFTTIIYRLHIFLVTRPPEGSAGFEQAWGQQHAPLPEHALRTRWSLFLPRVPEPRMQKDLVYATLPGSDRKLLCDLWLPPEGIPSSGLAFIYLHGSAFYFLDKDFCTRPFFRHLAAQGHVIMDVAYRMAPETDVRGMVHDAKRAILWMKENAGRYGIDPDHLVIGGGSAGAHLALLAAYTHDDARFTPAGLEGKDSSAGYVISLYGSSNMEDLYFHTNQHLTTRAMPGRPKKSVPTKMPKWIIRRMGSEYHRLGMDKGFENVGTLPPLLGGHPDECPENYALYSVITHVHAGCPPTLLVHGEHDIMAPVKSTRELYAELTEKNVPVVLHLLPQTEHGFDMVLPGISPAAHTAISDVDRFLAFIRSRTKAGPAEKPQRHMIAEYENTEV